jgi:hypothetical protein
MVNTVECLVGARLPAIGVLLQLARGYCQAATLEYE